MTLQTIIDTVLDTTRESNVDTIKRIIRKHYYYLCALTDWQMLRRSKQLVFAATETDGHYLPSDLIGVTSVVSEVSGSEEPYRKIEPSQRYLIGGMPKWFYPSVAVTPLDTLIPAANVGGASINENAGLFSATLGGDRINEYVQFDTHLGFYKITSASTSAPTITPVWRGPRIANRPAIVRPASTKKLVIVDAAGDLEGDTVTVNYWAFPEPLFQEWQQIMLPSARPLELLCIIEVLSNTERKQRQAEFFRQEYDNIALPNMLAQNPKSANPQIPRGRDGQAAFFGRRRGLTFIR
jgi:hypothetical protein